MFQKGQLVRSFHSKQHFVVLDVFDCFGHPVFVLPEWPGADTAPFLIDSQALQLIGNNYKSKLTDNK